MHLTLINFFKKTVPGHIFRGKRRLVRPVSRRAMESLRMEYEREDKIMFLLRHPYLSLVGNIFDNLSEQMISFLLTLFAFRRNLKDTLSISINQSERLRCGIIKRP